MADYSQKFYQLYKLGSDPKTLVVGPEIPAPTQTDNFLKACQSVSLAELDAFVQAFRSVQKPVPPEASLRQLAAQTHWSIPICFPCRQRDSTKLHPRTQCYLQFYCSEHCEEEHCEEEHWVKEHRERCGRQDAPFDAQADPYRPVLVKKC